MGTRADFYIGRGKDAEWLGSIAWDGYVEGIDEEVLQAKTESDFKKAVADFFASRDDSTLPEDGWPWPWNDSRTTDYAYAFDGEALHVACFGRWFDPSAEDDGDEDLGEKAEFPDMSARKNVAKGSRSGLIVITG